MNENINLCKILRDCPKGTRFYNYVYGWVKFVRVDSKLRSPIIICVTTRSGNISLEHLTSEGYITESYNDAKCSLVPSPEQPDWSKWLCPKPKFDPKTLKPFDKVVVKGRFYTWKCGLFSHIDNLDDADDDYKYICIGSDYAYCIPYNDETKHLVGTLDEAPEYYRYWED